MKHATWLVSIALASGSAGALAAELTLDNVSATKRASLLIRGRGLTPNEEAAARSGVGVVSKVDAYVRDDGFRTQMVANLSYLFRVKPPVPSQGHVTTLSMAFDRLIRENLSWDELLTSKVIFHKPRSTFDMDRGFYRGGLTETERAEFDRTYGSATARSLEVALGAAEPDPHASREDYVELKTASPQVAGVLTDPYFLRRYLNNPINQNRRRAAAIYRIFLCDDMRAIVLPDDRVSAEIEQLGLDRDANAQSAHLVADEHRHGDDPKCASCHYKLDPLAQVFRGRNTSLTRASAAGGLNFRRRNGELVSVPFNTADELARALVRQPEYASCQVRHFWNWFVGADVPLSAATESELVRQFDAVGRRPRDFVSYLMKRRDAFHFPQLSNDSMTFAHVSGVLAQCTRCHEGGKAAPDYRQIPFARFGHATPGEETTRMHEYNVEAMVHMMDLLGDGSRALMPPTNAGWTVNTEARARLLAWLAGGAKDGNGRATWVNPDLQAQLRQRVAQENLNFAYRTTLGWTAKRRMSIQQVKSTLAEWLRALGSPNAIDTTYDYNLDQHDSGAPIKIDSGQPSLSPSSEYGRRLHLLAENFRQSFTWDLRTRRALGLLGIFDSDDDVIRALCGALWGRVPAAGSAEMKRLREYLKGPAGGDPVRLAARLIESENFVNY